MFEPWQVAIAGVAVGVLCMYLTARARRAQPHEAPPTVREGECAPMKYGPPRLYNCRNCKLPKVEHRNDRCSTGQSYLPAVQLFAGYDPRPMNVDDDAIDRAVQSHELFEEMD